MQTFGGTAKSIMVFLVLANVVGCCEAILKVCSCNFPLIIIIILIISIAPATLKYHRRRGGN